MKYYIAILALGLGIEAKAQESSQKYLIQYHSPGLLKQTLEKLKSVSNRFQGRINVLNNSLDIVEALPRTRTLIIRATQSEILKLKKDPNIAFLEKEIIYKTNRQKYQSKNDRSTSIPEGYNLKADETEIQWGLEMIEAPAAWKLLENDTSRMGGTGARVLILDHGIDKNHPDIKSRFEKGRSFLGLAGIKQFIKIPFGIYNNFTSLSENSRYDYFDDETGHGTHVAGIVLGAYNGQGIAGSAPMAKLLLGRVCTPEECTTSDLVKGIEYGIEEAVDVVNISVGGKEISQAIVEAVKSAEAANIVVVSSSGNDGDSVVDYPAAHEESLAVGAVTASLNKWTLSNEGPELDLMAPGEDIYSSAPVGSRRKNKIIFGGAAIDFRQFVDSSDLERFTEAEVVFAGYGTRNELRNRKLKDKFVLIHRGKITFKDKVTNAIRAGAKGVLIANNKEGVEIYPAITAGEANVRIPVIMIEKILGEKMEAQINQSLSKSVKISRVQEISSYGRMSGTSMAAAYVSGVAALVRAANPSLTAAQVRLVLKTTARPLEFESGYGLVNAKNAVLKALSLNP